MAQKPTSTSAAAENQNVCETENRTKLAPSPTHAKAIQRPSEARSSRDASRSPPRSAPTPAQAISTPTPVGPAFNMRRANTGIRTAYEKPNRLAEARSRKIARKGVVRQANRKPSESSARGEPGEGRGGRGADLRRIR